MTLEREMRAGRSKKCHSKPRPGLNTAFERRNMGEADKRYKGHTAQGRFSGHYPSCKGDGQRPEALPWKG